MRDLVIIGAGGFGRETVDVVRALNSIEPTWHLVGVVDDAPSPTNLDRLVALGVEHLGGLSAIPKGVDVAVAVGSPITRARISEALASGNHAYPALVHPTATIGSEFRHGHGLIMLGGVSIGTNVTLGDHVHLNAHAVIGHDTNFCDFVSVNPNATISGGVVIGEGTLIGAAATVLQGIEVGTSSIIGAGAVVVRPVRDGLTVKGVPAV